MDLDEFRKQVAEFAGFGSAYRVTVEAPEDGDLMIDVPFLGSDAVQVLGMVAVHLLSQYSTIERIPPAGEIRVRITPVEEGS